jgi:hypothetical protein
MEYRYAQRRAPAGSLQLPPRMTRAAARESHHESVQSHVLPDASIVPYTDVTVGNDPTGSAYLLG